MSKKLYKIPVALAVEAPVLIAGGQAALFGLDVLHIRDPEGRPILPDTEFKGLLRAAWEALEDLSGEGALSTAKAFGQPTANLTGNDVALDGDLDGLRGVLLFRDLIADAGGEASRTTRVKIDDETGAAEEAGLVTEELIAPHGATVTYTGNVLALLPDDAKAAAVRLQIEDAIKLIYAIGKSKSAGYGRISGARVSEPVLRKDTAEALGEGDTYNLTFGLDAGLLIDVDRQDNNTLVGRSVIPGNVIKGALAQKLHDVGENPNQGALATALSQMTVGHALPIYNQQSAPDPLDHFQYIKKSDATKPWANLLETDLRSPAPIPAFPPDQKDHRSEAEKAEHSKSPRLERDVRTRVSIAQEGDRKGTAVDGALFAQSSVRPSFSRRVEGKKVWTALKWKSEVHWPGHQDAAVNAAFETAMKALAGGLYRIGKRACCTEHLSIETASADPWTAPTDGVLIDLVINTSAMLVRAEHLRDERTLSDALQHYWLTVSDGSLKIAEDRVSLPGDGVMAPEPTLDYYCQFEARSGFQALQFRPWGDQVVEPFVLVNPGSLFRLEVIDGVVAKRLLKTWLRGGLPVPIWASSNSGALQITGTFAGDDYKRCPFLPQNGYGHIQILDATGAAA